MIDMIRLNLAFLFSFRPMVFGSELQWEQEKELYVHSVVSHMYENPGVSNGKKLT